MPTRPSERAPYIFDSFHIISFSSLLSSIFPSFLLPPIETRGNQDGGHHSLDVARSFVVSPPTHPVARTYALLSHQSKTKQNGVLSSTKIVSSSKKLPLPSMNVRGGRLPPTHLLLLLLLFLFILLIFFILLVNVVILLFFLPLFDEWRETQMADANLWLVARSKRGPSFSHRDPVPKAANPDNYRRTPVAYAASFVAVPPDPDARGPSDDVRDDGGGGGDDSADDPAEAANRDPLLPQRP